jgi:hypothetical protein
MVMKRDQKQQQQSRKRPAQDAVPGAKRLKADPKAKGFAKVPEKPQPVKLLSK